MKLNKFSQGNLKLMKIYYKHVKYVCRIYFLYFIIIKLFLIVLFYSSFEIFHNIIAWSQVVCGSNVVHTLFNNFIIIFFNVS